MISGDTNLFFYAMDPRDGVKHAAAKAIVDAMGEAESIVGLQVVGELQNALRRRLRAPPGTAYHYARSVFVTFATFGYDERAVETALGEAIVGRLNYWDALLLSAADAAGVTVMISEDMRDGLRFRGLEVVDPFGADGPSERIRELLVL